MKIISVAIPCYNSAAYMRNCVESLLVDDEIEIIIVNDGSTKDNTLEIALEYKEKFPDIVKVIDKENGGHGSAVNAGIENATGKYFKVVDSDDKVDKINFKTIVDLLKVIDVDMFMSDYVYDKQGQKNKKTMSYEDIMPVNEVFGWSDIKKFKIDQYILMHSIIYKTEILIKCGLKLPNHTFYVDNLYAYTPLAYVEKMYYVNIPVYYYFIGREDQSVNEQVMISRLDQQIRVNKLMFDEYDLTELENPKIKAYMYHQLTIITAVSHVLLLKEGSEKSLQEKEELWDYFKEQNREMYNKIRYGNVIGNSLHMPGDLGKKTILAIYHMLQRHMGFN